ncbi:MAG: hypothetical protein ACYC96_01085 [Fimbriimonadaceae bacterium]
MDNHATGMPVEQAATELGVPADALRLYIASHKLSDPSSASIPDSQVTKLKDELRSRAGALRLDDLAKTALTIEWLAQAAVEAAEASENFDAAVSELERGLRDAKGHDVDGLLKPLTARIESLEGQSNESTTGALQMVGSMQGMIDSQGRELDSVRAEVSSLRSDVATLRSDIASLRLAVHGLEAKHHGFVAGLRSALQQDGAEPPGKAKAGAQVLPTTPAAEPKSEEAYEAVRPSPAAPEITPAAEPEEEALKFENVPVTTPAKFRVKREIEYNFLLERMGYRRLDSYTHDERAQDKLPGDEEIAEFLAKFELGCEAEELEMVSVQRGEYHMVQYQRIDKSSGIRSWISRGRN